jgi:hypothetical protein
VAKRDAAAEAKSGHKILDDRLAQLVHDRQTLARDAKLGIILLAVLFLLYREYTPMVAADHQIENQLGAQVRSLVVLEGHIDRLNRIVADGFAPWQQSVNAQLDEALARVIALDDYGEQLLASSPGDPQDVPEFVTRCAEEKGILQSWIAAPETPAPWREIVERCIIEPIDKGFTPPAPGSLGYDLLAVRNEVNAAVADARTNFQLTAVEVTVTPNPVPSLRLGVSAIARRPARADSFMVTCRSATGVPTRTFLPLSSSSPVEQEAVSRILSSPDCVEVEIGGRPITAQILAAESVSEATAGAATPAAIIAVPAARAPIDSVTRLDDRSPITIVLTTPTPSPSPTPVPLSETLDAIEWEVNWAAQLITRRPSETTNPVASNWWEAYAFGESGLRSFRDNLLLDLALPSLLGSAQTGRSSVSVLKETERRTFRIEPPNDPSTGLTRVTLQTLLGNLQGTLSRVRDEQERLQAEIAAQTSELESAVPDFAKPVLAVARPKYLVLGYPLLIAGVGAYLMATYTFLKDNIRQWRQEYETTPAMTKQVLDVGLAQPHWLVLGVLAGAPLFFLALLGWSNDWPQLWDGDWRWAYWVSLVIVVATAVGCVVYLHRSKFSTPSGKTADSPATPAPEEKESGLLS